MHALLALQEQLLCCHHPVPRRHLACFRCCLHDMPLKREILATKMSARVHCSQHCRRSRRRRAPPPGAHRLPRGSAGVPGSRHLQHARCVHSACRQTSCKNTCSTSWMSWVASWTRRRSSHDGRQVCHCRRCSGNASPQHCSNSRRSHDRSSSNRSRSS